MTALEATGLGVRYGQKWALHNCSLRVPEGSIVALVGPNGAGKSTLMQLVVGLIRPTEGTITTFGAEPGRTSTSLARVGFLAQDHPLYPSLSVEELLRLGRAMNPRWDQGLAERQLEQLNIPLRSKAGKLSGGQRAQVALALALAKRADLLVLDEPVSSLDPVARHSFMATLLTNAADHGTTVLLSSHVISELDRACDYLISLTGGSVQLDGPIDWLLERHRVLTGPRVPDGHIPAGVQRLLNRTDTDRQTTMLVESHGPVLDPAWQQSAVDLQELVLAYMQNPPTALRYWPESTRPTAANR